MSHLRNLTAARKRPSLKIRRLIGPHWITGRRGRVRYAVRSFRIRTTVLHYGGA